MTPLRGYKAGSLTSLTGTPERAAEKAGNRTPSRRLKPTPEEK
jgi:hypothetical protein